MLLQNIPLEHGISSDAKEALCKQIPRIDATYRNRLEYVTASLAYPFPWISIHSSFHFGDDSSIYCSATTFVQHQRSDFSLHFDAHLQMAEHSIDNAPTETFRCCIVRRPELWEYYRDPQSQIFPLETHDQPLKISLPCNTRTASL